MSVLTTGDMFYTAGRLFALPVASFRLGVLIFERLELGAGPPQHLFVWA